MTTLPAPSHPATAAQPPPLLGPDIRATVLLIAVLCGLTLFGGKGDTPYAVAQEAAISIGLALGAGFLFELQKGLKNLFRVDLICLVGLYGLTLTEFLLPQPTFDRAVTLAQTEKGLVLVYLGFGSLTIGRHLLKPKSGAGSRALQLPSLPPAVLVLLAVGAAVVGNFYMFFAVGFDLVVWFEELLDPRFSQAWGRGRYGGWKELLNELGLITYIIPPIAGMALARRKEFSMLQLITILGLYFFTLFTAFASGTRYVFAVLLGTFAISNIFSLSRLKLWYVGTLSVVILGVFIFGAYHMLEFRTIGLRNYLKNEVYASESTRDTLFIDFNLVSLSLLADRFPGEYRYLGLEIPIWALTKPIPRAIWKEKPRGLSIDIEQALGDRSRTVAAAFIGEAYMGGGKIGVILAGLFFGVLSAWWNRVAADSQSTLSLLAYATGFFGGIICMRSMFWLTTAILPTLALIVFGKFIYPRLFASTT